MTIAEIAAVAKKIEAVEPVILTDAKTLLTTFGPEAAALFPKIGGDLTTAGQVLDFLSRSTPQLTSGFDAAIAFLTQLEAAL